MTNKPLKVALIVKNKPGPYKREDRNMGYWSYQVEQFTWDHFSPGDYAVVDVDSLARQGYDLIFHEDGGNWCTYKGHSIPILFMDIDSTLSDSHYAARLSQAKRSDLVLVDHDKLDRFSATKVPVRRWNYCVNDHVFRNQGKRKITDVSFHCSAGDWPGGVERRTMRQNLDKWAKSRGKTYVSGVRGLPEYALSFGQSKICVNLPRTSINRPHRVFDVMASHSMLLTGPIPIIDGDEIFDGKHYVKFDGQDDLEYKLDTYLDNLDRVARITETGYNLVMSKHTWSRRARQLLDILREERLV